MKRMGWLGWVLLGSALAQGAWQLLEILRGTACPNAGVFDRWLAGRKLAFAWDGKGFVDLQRKSRWDLRGRTLGRPQADSADPRQPPLVCLGGVF